MDLSQSVGPCPFCRSTRYTPTGTGFLVCEHGHQSQKFWQEEQDDFDTNAVVTTRRIRRALPTPSLSTIEGEQEEEEEGEGGAEGRVLRLGNVDKFWVFKGLQYVLMAQVEAVRTFLHLPRSFDAIVQRFWLAFVTSTGLEYSEEVVAEQGGEEIDLFHEILRVFAQDAPSPADASPAIISPSQDDIFPGIIPSPPGNVGEAEEATQLGLPLEDEAAVGPATELLSPLPEGITFPPVSKSSQTVTMATPRVLLILIYFALQEMGVPILLGDVRRMILDGVLPYDNISQLIPRPTRRALERRKQMLMFRAKKWVPSVFHMMGLASALAHQLAARTRLLIRPLNLGALVDRLAVEFSLPRKASIGGACWLMVRACRLLCPHDSSPGGKV